MEPSTSPQKSSGERRASLSRYLSRAKSVLRRDKSKRASVLGESSSTPAAPGLVSSSVPAPASDPQTIAAEQKPDPEPTEPTEQKPTESPTKPTNVRPFNTRTAVHQERAKAMFAKYGFTLEDHEWNQPPEPRERVMKPIRMRVHRTCHRCQTTFGAEKICASCSHKRCKKCPRYPVKKPKVPQDGAAGAVEPAPQAKARSQFQLLLPSKTGGQDLVRKDVKQTVHRKCHKCDTQFGRGEKTCAKCKHVRCTKCPREPPKLDKYPHGYPGDVEAESEPEWQPFKQRVVRRPRLRVRFYCHQCDTLYRDHRAACASCQHERCKECRREPPKKIKAPPDPKVLESLQEKLAKYKLEDETETSAGESRPGVSG